jgi:hypothetical protein
MKQFYHFVAPLGSFRFGLSPDDGEARVLRL